MTVTHAGEMWGGGRGARHAEERDGGDLGLGTFWGTRRGEEPDATSPAEKAGLGHKTLPGCWSMRAAQWRSCYCDLEASSHQPGEGELTESGLPGLGWLTLRKRTSAVLSVNTTTVLDRTICNEQDVWSLFVPRPSKTRQERCFLCNTTLRISAGKQDLCCLL